MRTDQLNHFQNTLGLLKACLFRLLESFGERFELRSPIGVDFDDDIGSIHISSYFGLYYLLGYIVLARPRKLLTQAFLENNLSKTRGPKGSAISGSLLLFYGVMCRTGKLLIVRWVS